MQIPVVRCVNAKDMVFGGAERDRTAGLLVANSGCDLRWRNTGRYRVIERAFLFNEMPLHIVS
jgi:hypothetical protein